MKESNKSLALLIVFSESVYRIFWKKNDLLGNTFTEKVKENKIPFLEKTLWTKKFQRQQNKKRHGSFSEARWIWCLRAMKELNLVVNLAVNLASNLEQGLEINLEKTLQLFPIIKMTLCFPRE